MRIMKACASVIGAVLMTFSVAATSRASNASSPSDRALVERGSYLARAGDCEACQTKPGGAPYAGGEAINSPFGALYAPNLTPDAVHGIGAWSDNDFYRAMHEGVGRQGQNLYPAFPYQWFTEVTRDDVLAIRAFLKTVPPSSEPSKPNRLMFPFDIRAGLGPWDALSSTLASSSRIRRSRTHGTAEPISSKALAIAAIATHRRDSRWRLKTPKLFQAARSTTGMRRT